MEKVKNNTTYQLGDVGERFIAIAVDGIILGLVTGLLFGAGGEIGGGVGLVVGVIYNWFFWTRYDGQTPGKRMVGLRVIKADGTKISDVDAFIRALAYYVSGFFFGIGYLWAIFDDENRTWHDLMAKTLVVKA